MYLLSGQERFHVILRPGSPETDFNLTIFIEVEDMYGEMVVVERVIQVCILITIYRFFFLIIAPTIYCKNLLKRHHL